MFKNIPAATLLVVSLIVFDSFQAEAGRIRNRKVKEAPKVCALMQEDVHLTRDGKMVYGTLRHSLVFENDEQMNNISLVKDKGEKICQWQSKVWNQIMKTNQVENQMGFNKEESLSRREMLKIGAGLLAGTVMPENPFTRMLPPQGHTAAAQSGVIHLYVAHDDHTDYFWEGTADTYVTVLHEILEG